MVFLWFSYGFSYGDPGPRAHAVREAGELHRLRVHLLRRSKWQWHGENHQYIDGDFTKKNGDLMGF